MLRKRNCGLINLAVSQKDLRSKVLELADKLMAKSPNVLKATKQAVRMVRTMDFDQSYDYMAAKGQEIKVGDVRDSYNTGLKQFLNEKSYKPTFQPFALKKPAAKKANAKKSSEKAIKKPTRRKRALHGES